MVERLIVEEGVCKGVVTQAGAEYTAKTVVITTEHFTRRDYHGRLKIFKWSK